MLSCCLGVVGVLSCFIVFLVCRVEEFLIASFYNVIVLIVLFCCWRFWIFPVIMSSCRLGIICVISCYRVTGVLVEAFLIASLYSVIVLFVSFAFPVIVLSCYRVVFDLHFRLSCYRVVLVLWVCCRVIMLFVCWLKSSSSRAFIVLSCFGFIVLFAFLDVSGCHVIVLSWYYWCRIVLSCYWCVGWSILHHEPLSSYRVIRISGYHVIVLWCCLGVIRVLSCHRVVLVLFV